MRNASASSCFCLGVLRADLRPEAEALDTEDDLPTGRPRFLSVVCFEPAAESFFLRPVELLARGVFVFGVFFAGELFFEDRPPRGCSKASSSYPASS